MYAFEPNTYILEKLHFNVNLNSLKHVSIEEYGVGVTNGECSFYEENTNPHEGMSSLHKEHLHNPVEVKIQLKTLESILQEKGIERIDFINIDIE